MKILCVIFCCSVLMKFVIISPFFVCDSCILSFWSISLPSRFTVLCGITSISQFGAAVFPDDKSMLRGLFILILLLLKHLNSPSFVALFTMFFPSLFVSQFAVVCETGLLLFASRASSVYKPVYLAFSRMGFYPVLSNLGLI